jgi:hypothetical protein
LTFLPIAARSDDLASQTDKTELAPGTIANRSQVSPNRTKQASMRSFTLAVVGLAALSQALPTGGALEERQLMGEPSTTLTPGSSPSPQEAPKPNTPFILPAEPYQAPEEGPRISTTRTKRAALNNIKELEETYYSLAKPYANRECPLSTFLILQQLAGILAAAGHPVNVIVLGPASTHFQISSKERRQDGVFGIGGGCKVDDLVSLLITYSSLQSIYGTNPPAQIKALKEAIAAALKYCNMDPETGGIVPDKPVPGGPIIPDKPAPGAPITPDKPSQGAPLTPDKPAPGAPMTPSS